MSKNKKIQHEDSWLTYAGVIFITFACIILISRLAEWWLNG